MVLLENYNPAVDSVIIDNFKGGLMAAEHLIHQGRKRIGLIMGTAKRYKDSFTHHRQAGYLKALRAASLPFLPQLLHHAPEYSFENGYEIAKTIASSKTRPDAIFCGAGDTVAIGLIRGLNEKGIRVPQDISVVGFDDITLARYMNPPLTTIHQPLFEAGIAAVGCILDHLEKNREDTQKIVLDPSLVVRSST